MLELDEKPMRGLYVGSVFLAAWSTVHHLLPNLTRYSPRKGVCWTITGKQCQAPVAESLRLPPATQGGK